MAVVFAVGHTYMTSPKWNVIRVIPQQRDDLLVFWYISPWFSRMSLFNMQAKVNSGV